MDIWLLTLSHTLVCRVTSYDDVTSDYVTWWIIAHIITHHCVQFASHRSHGSWDTKYFTCHVINCSRDQSIKRLNGWWSLTINTHLVHFGNHRPRRSEDLSFFICHVNSCGHVTKGSSLLNVVVIRLLEVEILHILIFNVRRRIHMIILSQNITSEIGRLLLHISY